MSIEGTRGTKKMSDFAKRFTDSSKIKYLQLQLM